MSLVTLNEIHVSFGPQVVLEDVQLVVHPGDRMGVVGPNGSGKSTLLGVILGRIAPSIGRIQLARKLSIGHLPQEVAVNEQMTLDGYLRSAFASTDRLAEAIGNVGEQLADAEPGERDALMRRLARLQSELDAAGGYHYESKIAQVCAGLGLDQVEPDRPLARMSGGQVARAALGRLLLTGPDLLLLDEPTNHLDLAATEWLEGFLSGYAGAMLIVSHDRYLLGKVAAKVLHVEGRKLRLFGMGYADYVQTQQVERLQQQRDHARQQEFITKERDFIARFRSGSRSKEARGRERRLERRIRDGELAVERVRTEKRLAIHFNIDRRGGDMIVRCTELCKAYGDNVLFDGFELEITRGQKFGLLGPNGVGKTSLLHLLTGRVQPDRGQARLFEQLDVGYFDQHQAQLDSDGDVLGELASATSADRQLLRNLLGRFGFAGEAIEKPVRSLSGGERSRLALLKLVLGNHQVLLMDEPTNHLDIGAREALEEALAAFPGSLIIASHDRYFLDRVVDHLLLMQPGGAHESFTGNYSDWQRESAERAARARSAEPERPRPASRRRRTTAKRKRDNADNWPVELRPLADLSVARLEEHIIECEFELEALHNQFTDPGIYDDPARLAEVGRSIRRVKEQLALYNRAWERRVG